MSKLQHTLVKTFKSAALNSSSWIVVLVLNLVATPFLVKHLGTEGFGLMIIMGGILGYLTIVDFSFRDSLVKYIAEYSAKEDFKAARDVFNSVIAFQLILAVICSTGLVVAADTVLSWFKVSPGDMHEAHRAYIVMALGFPFALLNGIYASLPVAMQRFDVAAVISATAGSLTIIGSVAVVADRLGLTAIMAWNIVVLAASCIAYHIWMRRTHSWFGLNLHFERTVIRKLFAFSLLTQLAKSASMVNDQVVRILVGSLLGPAAVTYYSVPLRLINGLQALLDKMARVMFPLASHLEATEELETLRNGALLVSKCLCILTTPIYLVLAVYSHDILDIWMGRGFAQRGTLVLTLSAVTYAFVSWTMIPSNIAFGLGRARINAIFSVIVAAANIVLVYFLAKGYGIVGVASALLITQVQVPLFVIMVTNSLAPRFGWRFLREAFLIPFGLGVVVLGVGWLFQKTASSPVCRIFVGGPVAVVAYYSAAWVTNVIPRDIFRRLRSAIMAS